MTDDQLRGIESRAHPLDDDKWELIHEIKRLRNRIDELEMIQGIAETEHPKTLYEIFK